MLNLVHSPLCGEVQGRFLCGHKYVKCNILCHEEVMYMLDVIISVIMLCLAVVGLIEMFRVISFFFCERKNTTITLIPIYGHVEDIEIVLRNAMSNSQWLSNKDTQRIICLDLGIDEETRNICEIFKEEHECIELYSLNEFNEVILQAVQ